MTEPTPVLLTTRELDQGGIERDVAKICMGLDRARFTPHIATYSARGMRFEEIRAAGVPVLEIPVGSLTSVGALQSAVRLWRYLKRHRIRLVHSYDASGIFALPVARLAGVPVVMTSQLSYRAILDSKTQQLLRWSDRFSDAVLVNCEAIRKYMIEDEHVPADRVELCYNGVETSVFYPAAAARPEAIAGASLVIGAVCALRSEKALPLLQEAFAKVWSRQPDMKLLMVGSGVELTALTENARTLGIEPASVFIPATAAVASWMRAIDIFVLPSYSEAFSNSLLEAMACGCCVVGSRVGGTPELIGNDERGLLFESRNADDLAAKLSALIADPDQRRALGAKAAAFAREHLTIEIAVRRTAEIWERRLALKRAT
jgi:glycosyltransferase involved in cell wall biosynthesis